MENISGFFNRFKNKIVGEIRNRDIIVDLINKYTKAVIEIKDISINNGVIRVNCSQIVKNEIFIKKNKILGEINKLITSTKFSDIK